MWALKKDGEGELMIRKSIVAAVIIFLASALPSCVSKGPLFTKIHLDDTSDPVMYIYRAEEDCLEDLKFDFMIDESSLATVGGNEYVHLRVTPGEHIITSGGIEKEDIPPLKIMVRTERGKSYFVKYEITCDSQFYIMDSTIYLKFKLMDTMKALKEISQVHLSQVPVTNLDMGER